MYYLNDYGGRVGVSLGGEEWGRRGTRMDDVDGRCSGGGIRDGDQ